MKSMTDDTAIPETPAPNSPEARMPDGTLKEASPATTTPTTPTPEPEGESFLTGKKDAPQGEPEGKDAPKEPTKPDAPQGAPEKYADFKRPEGYTFDEASLTKAT